MSVTGTREVPYEVESAGGFPSLDEFDAVCKALADAEEFGVSRLFTRINTPIVDAYEAEDQTAVPYTYENLGVLAAKVEDLDYWVGDLVDQVTKLKALIGEVGAALADGGRVETSPKFGRYGGEYEPSQKALEQWGLVKPKDGDDAS